MPLKKNVFAVMVLQSLLITSCAQNNKQTNSRNTPMNNLAEAKSPYLRQHADNPVNWQEWGPDALKQAKDENKPLLISIGYAACHWCHVMEHESFMDSSVANLMNEKFIPIKIDREERPDIDQIYMNAVQLLTGRGGWPLNAFALPDGRPFYAGTYYPKEQWKQVLAQMSDVYLHEYEKVEQQAHQLTQNIKRQEVITVPGDSTLAFSETTYAGIYKNSSTDRVGWRDMIDFQKGGYKRAPKFPLPIGWEFLLQYQYLTGNEEALQAVKVTLDKMAKGGIYDQLGGGFARYSTDAEWFVPHFEKMLYDNGQLISLYAHAYKVTKQETYAKVIRETLQFIDREMTDPKGGFYSSLNADSEGEEGKFYVWTQNEINKILGEKNARLISDYYQLKKSGNWEHNKNILYRKENLKEFTKDHQLTVAQWEQSLAKAKARLLLERDKRIRPSTDNKILTSWNALMLKGYVDAYLALGNKEYLKSAIRNAQFLEENMVRDNGRLWRNYKDGEAAIEAFLDDYALLADAYILLYQATFDAHWLNQARTVTDYAIAHFRDDASGMFYYTSDQSETLIARKMEISDNVIPASNSVMAHVLYKLGEYYYHKPYINMSKTMLNHVSEEVTRGGPYHANWAMLMGLMTHKPFEVAIMGAQAIQKNQAIQKSYLPTSLFMGGQVENLPLLKNKRSENQTLIYVCRNKACKRPTAEVSAALGQIADEHE